MTENISVLSTSSGARENAKMNAMSPLEQDLEQKLVEKLLALKYEHRPDIRDRAALEKNFRQKFEALNRVTLTEGEFPRLLEEIIHADVFTAARTLRERNSFTRDDGTPLNYTLVNIKDWCKNTFEVVNQLRINTDNSYIWHTTGSGKTLTSFKASTLLKDNPDIEKCL